MNTQLQNALNESPEAISRFLAPIFSDENFDATISKQQFNELLELSDLNDADLRVALLPFAAAFSYAPISKFFVGAIVRGLSGRLYFGANIEVSGVQLGQAVHAEQSAISHAWMKGEEGVTDITINYSPCGHCRQFMNELNTAKELLIQLPQKDQKSLQEYLPESFGPADLGVTSGLMTKVNHNCSSGDNDPLIAAALERLNMSHAPYTKNLSGTALRLKNGRVYSGAYAENAAFNPSLPPLQVAMIQLLMDGASIDDIETAALVEMSAGSISHVADTQATLEAINPDITLSYLAI